MNLYLLYFFTGTLGGFFGGLLGLGGGIIFVPFLFFIFNHFDIHSTHIMQSAICTSLACIVISSLSSTYKHNKNKLIDWSIFKKMLIGLLIGSAFGIAVISYLTSDLLKYYYGFFLILISIYIFLSKEKTINTAKEFKYIRLFSLFTGFLSSVLGIGGGTITTPYMRYHGKPIKECIATAAACGIPIAIVSVLVSILININLSILDNIIGFIHLESFIIISIASLFFSYIGASVTYVANSFFIRSVFSTTVLIMGLIIISS